MSHMLALLDEMRARRLGMYLGTPSLTKLADFLRGYELAVGRLRPDEADPFLADFRDWVYRRFQTTENVRWEQVILRHSADETEAVDRFWELLDEYRAQRDRAAPAVPTVGSPANTPTPTSRPHGN